MSGVSIHNVPVHHKWKSEGLTAGPEAWVAWAYPKCAPRAFSAPFVWDPLSLTVHRAPPQLLLLVASMPLSEAFFDHLENGDCCWLLTPFPSFLRASPTCTARVPPTVLRTGEQRSWACVWPSVSPLLACGSCTVNTCLVSENVVGLWTLLCGEW